jgi:hypothetical protein
MCEYREGMKRTTTAFNAKTLLIEQAAVIVKQSAATI